MAISKQVLFSLIQVNGGVNYAGFQTLCLNESQILPGQIYVLTAKRVAGLEWGCPFTIVLALPNMTDRLYFEVLHIPLLFHRERGASGRLIGWAGTREIDTSFTSICEQHFILPEINGEVMLFLCD